MRLSALELDGALTPAEDEDELFKEVNSVNADGGRWDEWGASGLGFGLELAAADAEEAVWAGVDAVLSIAVRRDNDQLEADMAGTRRINDRKGLE